MNARLLCMVFFCTLSAAAQPLMRNDSVQLTNTTYRTSYILGAGTSSVGLTAALGFSDFDKSTFTTYRCIYSEEFLLYKPTPPNSAWEIGALYGFFRQSSSGIISLSAGMALTSGVKRGALISRTNVWLGKDTYEQHKFVETGIPILAQFIWTPYPESKKGFGVTFFANINLSSSYYGATLEAHIFD